MKIISLFLLSAVMLSFNASANTQLETQHLLNFVKNTQCQYERNGTLHTGIEAVKHIQKKYDYFLDDIKSTEDFIEYSATKSKMSGKEYKIHCADTTVQTSSVWLHNELKRFRDKRAR